MSRTFKSLIFSASLLAAVAHFETDRAWATPAAGELDFSTASMGVNNPISNVEQLSAAEWVFSVVVAGRDMRSARNFAFDAAAQHVASTLDLELGVDQETYLKSLILVDEAHSDDVYTAHLRAISLIDDPSYKLRSARDTVFDSAAAPDLIRPKWVLIVPVDVDEAQIWSLSGAKTSWFSQWKIPFRDGVTQFIPATIDADDKAFSKEADSFEELSQHLMERYKAENILYVAKDAAGAVQVFQWGARTSMAPPLEVGVFKGSSDVTLLRSAVLDGYWSLYQPTEALASELEAAITEGIVKYREIGQPQEDIYGYSSGWLQLIDVSPDNWQSIEDRLIEIRGFSIQSIKDYNSSLLVNYRFQTESVPDLRGVLRGAGLMLDG